jgi:DNA-binding NarL/FixJ family response regulator
VTTSIRILLADDHPMVRHGLRMVLDAEPDLAVVAEASDGHEAVQVATETEIDIAILDVAMPRRTGLQAARQLAKLRPQVRTLMLSMYESERYLTEAIRAGARGYVLKSAADQDLVSACRTAMRSEAFLYPKGAGPSLARYAGAADVRDTPPWDLLTPREEEVVKLIAEGHTSQQIADLLVISIKTVESHRANIFEKLAVRDRVGLTRFAIRSGLIEP